MSTSFDNTELLRQMSEAAKAGTPGLETHPDYKPRESKKLTPQDLKEIRKEWRKVHRENHAGERYNKIGEGSKGK